MSTHIISATEASRTLSDILNMVHYQGERYEIKRGNNIVAQIIPASSRKKIASFKVKKLGAFFKQLKMMDADDSDAFLNDIEDIRAQNKVEDKSWD